MPRRDGHPTPGSLWWLLWVGCFAFGGVFQAPAGAQQADSGERRILERLGKRRAAGASVQELVEEARAVAQEADSAEAASLEEGEEIETEEPVEWGGERVGQAPPEIEEEPAEGKEMPFGYDLFAGSPATYRQPEFGPVDPDYPLGPGDEIVVDVWGDTVFRIDRMLDRDGAVNIPDVGRVVLAGMSLSDARSTLRQRMARVYSGLTEQDGPATTHLAVTLGKLRVVRVFVVGRVRRPGGYDLSAAATVFHGLFFAGGPSLSGTMRDVRLLRGGEVVGTLDVYEYLRTGNRGGDVRLENDDTIFVPRSGARVRVLGEVNEPGIYEVLPGETLAAAVETAGGLSENAFSGRVQVERIVSGTDDGAVDRKIIDAAWGSGAELTELEDGDVVRVFPIADRIRNFVTIQGEVRRPGVYELQEGAHLSHLVEEAGGLLETALLSRAELVRTREDETRAQIAVDLTHSLTGDAGADILLQPRDHLVVHSIWKFRDEARVSIHGCVREPGPYELRENMTLRDLILQAGGLAEDAFPEYVEISRIDPDEGQMRTADILKVFLGEDYLTCAEGGFPLEPYDNVFVRREPFYELQRNVSVAGEVRFPGAYTLQSPTETIVDVIERAGGLKETAFPEGFQLVRKEGQLGRVALDLRKALKDPRSKDNVLLLAGDSLHVPREPRTVTVKGEVGYPTSLVYDPGWGIGDYVDHAGGNTDRADAGQTRVIYTTGAAARVKRFWFDPKVRPGSTIIVPPREEKERNWGVIIRDTTSILASLATVALVADRISN